MDTESKKKMESTDYDQVGMYLRELLNEKFRYDPSSSGKCSQNNRLNNDKANTISNDNFQYDTIDIISLMSWKHKKISPLISIRNLRLLCSFFFEFVEFLYHVPNHLFSFFRLHISTNPSTMRKNLVTTMRAISIMILIIWGIILFAIAAARTTAKMICFEALMKLGFFSVHILVDFDDIYSILPFLRYSILISKQIAGKLYSIISLEADISGRTWQANRIETTINVTEKEQYDDIDVNNDLSLNRISFLNLSKEMELDPTILSNDNVDDLGLSNNTIKHCQCMDFVWIMRHEFDESNKHVNDGSNTHRRLRSIDQIIASASSGEDYSLQSGINKTSSYQSEHTNERIKGRSRSLSSQTQYLDYTITYSRSSQEEDEKSFSSRYLSTASSFDRDCEGIEVYESNSNQHNQTDSSLISRSQEIGDDAYLQGNQISTPPAKKDVSSNFISDETESEVNSLNEKAGSSDWVDVGTRLGLLILNSEKVKKISKDGISSTMTPTKMFTSDIEPVPSESDSTTLESSLPFNAELKSSPIHNCTSNESLANRNSSIEPPHKDNILRMRNVPPSIPVHSMWSSPSDIKFNLETSVRKKEKKDESKNNLKENVDEILMLRESYEREENFTLTDSKQKRSSLTAIITHNNSKQVRQEYIAIPENNKISNDLSLLNADKAITTQRSYDKGTYHFHAQDFMLPKTYKKHRMLETPIEVQHIGDERSSPDFPLVKNTDKMNQLGISTQSKKIHQCNMLLPGCKMVLPVCYQGQGSKLKQTLQMTTVVSCHRIILPISTSGSYNVPKKTTNFLSLHLQIDKSFLKNGRFAQMYIRIPDDPSQMPRHSCFPIGSCVATSFGIGVVAGWRVEDDVYIIRALWKKRGSGSAYAYMQKNAIHGIIEAGIGFKVRTKRGKGKVLAYVNGGKDQLQGRFFVLFEESGHQKGHVLELNRSDILSCPSAKYIPVIEQIRAAAHYQIQLDSYKAAVQGWDVDFMKPLQWSKEIEILSNSFIAAVEENPNFDHELNNLTSSLISFLEDLDIGNKKKETNDSIDDNKLENDATLKNIEHHAIVENEKNNKNPRAKFDRPFQSAVWTEPGLLFFNDLFGGIFKENDVHESKNKPELTNSSESSIESEEERNNYERAYAFIKTLRRTLAIAQANIGSSRQDLRLALSIISEMLVFIRIVVKVRQTNVSKEAKAIRSRTFKEMKATLYPIQKRIARVSQGIVARLEEHGTRAKARLLHLCQMLVNDEKLLLALEHGDWAMSVSRIERNVVKAQILDSERCAQFHEKFLIVMNTLAPQASQGEDAALRSGEKIASFARVMKWLAEPRQTILKFITRDDVAEILERILVRVLKNHEPLSDIANIYAYNFRSIRYFRMFINMEMSATLWLPFLDAADEELSWAVTRMPENTRKFVVPIAKLFSLGVASFREVKNTELAAEFLREEPARSFIHELDMKLVLAIESFCNDIKQMMTILPYYARLDDDFLDLLDEVDLDEMLKEMSAAMLDSEKFAMFLIEKSKNAVDRFLHYLPKISIPIERRDISEGWVLTCRGKNGGHLTLSEVKVESENLICRVLGSKNVFAFSNDENDETILHANTIDSEESELVEDMNSTEVSILTHVKELILNAERYGSWKPGRGGITKKTSFPGTPLDGIPLSEVLRCAVELWQNLDIDDDELMEIVIRDISYQIQCQRENDRNEDRNDSTGNGVVKDNEQVNKDEQSLCYESSTGMTKKFNPRIDPTVLFLDLKGMTLNLNDFLFQIEPKVRNSIFDPVFEGYGTLLIKNTSITMRVECRKERLMKLGAELTVPVLQLQQLDVSLYKVKFKFKDTGADWLLNKTVSGLSKNLTEIVEANVKEQIVSHIHRALEHINAFIEVNPDLMLKVLGITIDDLEENIVWV